MDWTNFTELEEVDIYEKTPKKMKYDDNTNKKNTLCKFENKLKEIMEMMGEINTIINELHILYKYKQ